MRKMLSDSQATAEAVGLYDYLCALEGKGILAGQQENPTSGFCGSELRYIRSVTGKLPALRGLDYIDEDYGRVNRRAIRWHRQGGIVTICWHWGTPPDGIGYPSSKGTVDMEQVLTPGNPVHEGMLRKMDQVAQALLQLQRAGVPVLWRPFHEFDGQWFWWGKGGPESFVRLWKLMYERFTKKWQLHNLIWVLGYCGDFHEGWYPGDDYVDIVGSDTYREGIQEEMYRVLERHFGDRMLICYHENGPIPDPQGLQDRKVAWSWFMTWHTIHIRQQNTKDYLRYVYSHDYVITLDRLPGCKEGD